MASLSKVYSDLGIQKGIGEFEVQQNPRASSLSRPELGAGGLTMGSHQVDEISLSGPLTAVPSVTPRVRLENGAWAVLALTC